MGCCVCFVPYCHQYRLTKMAWMHVKNDGGHLASIVLRYSVVVSTPDFESGNSGSNPGTATSEFLLEIVRCICRIWCTNIDAQITGCMHAHPCLHSHSYCLHGYSCCWRNVTILIYRILQTALIASGCRITSQTSGLLYLVAALAATLCTSERDNQCFPRWQGTSVQTSYEFHEWCQDCHTAHTPRHLGIVPA